MDFYSVDFVGASLNIEFLQQSLEELDCANIYRKGEVTFLSEGVLKQSQRSIPFEESSINFRFNGECLHDFLHYLCSKELDDPKYAIERVIIWAVMNREEQINGELSEREIANLNKLGASFCWSVI